MPSPPPPTPGGKTLIGASRRRKLWSLASYEKYNGNSDQTERLPTLIWVFAGRLWSFHLFLFCWGPYKNVYATFVHGTHLIYNASAGNWASWSFLHRECAIEKKNLIVLWSDDDDDDDDCCDGGGAEWWLWWWSYAAWGISPLSQINKLNKTVSGVFKHRMLYRNSKGSPLRLFSICISNRSPSCFLKPRGSSKGASDRESAMNNLSTEFADSGPASLGKRIGESWTRRHVVNYNSHMGY